MPVLQTSRNDSHHAVMPAVSDDEQRVLLALRRRDRLGGRDDLILDRLALAIVEIERGSHLVSFRHIVGGQQARTEIATADPAARVYPRAKDETQMIGG